MAEVHRLLVAPPPSPAAVPPPPVQLCFPVDRSGMRLCISKLSTDLRTGICHEEASLLEISRALRKSRNASWKTEDGRRENGLTDLAFERLFLAEALQMLFRYSDGLSKVLESALANLGGMNGSTMCLLTR